MSRLPHLPLLCALLLVPTTAAIGIRYITPPAPVPAGRASVSVPADLRPLDDAPLPTAPPSAQPRSTPPAAALRPTDPYFGSQSDLLAIRMPEAWAVQRSAAVTVAVLDTGYVPSEELGPRLTPGYDFVSDPNRSGDGDGRDRDPAAVGQFAYHGEAVANQIGAAHDGRGVVGVNPAARIVAVRVVGTDGTIAPQDLADAVRWSVGLPVAGVPANPAPARLLNLSLYADFIPLTGCDSRVGAAVRAATATGALLIVGAGNDDADVAGYTPAACDGAVSVTALDSAGARAGYANWGRKISLAAPGGTPAQGLTLWSRGAPLTKNGTSFAAPLVTGVASLLLGRSPTLSPAALTRALTTTARPFVGGRCDPDPLKTCGSGLLDAAAALRSLR